MIELLLAIIMRPVASPDYIMLKTDIQTCSIAGESYFATNAPRVTISRWGNFGSKTIDLHPGDFIEVDYTGWIVTDFNTEKVPPVNLTGMKSCD